MDVRVVDHPLAAARLTTLRDERTDNAGVSGRVARADADAGLRGHPGRAQRAGADPHAADRDGRGRGWPSRRCWCPCCGPGWAWSTRRTPRCRRRGWASSVSPATRKPTSRCRIMESLPDDLTRPAGHGPRSDAGHRRVDDAHHRPVADAAARRISPCSVWWRHRKALRRWRRSRPNARVFTAAVDDGLNEIAYIVPGLGDAGDRQFGPR